jgi:hypothetical protein
MSVLVSAYVWRHSQSKGSTRLLLLALADLADDDGIIPPHRSASIAYLTSKCNFDSERTTRYCLRELEGKAMKVGDKMTRPGIEPPELATSKGAGQRPSRYQILMRQLPLFDAGGQHVEHDLPAESESVDKSVDGVENDDSKGQAVAPLTGNGLPLQGARNVLPRGQRLPPTARKDVKRRKGRGAQARDPTPTAPVDKPPGGEYIPGPAVIAWAAEQGYAAYLHLHLGVFRDKVSNGYRAKNLDAAFRNCVRGDWEHVRMQAQRSARMGQAPDLERWWTTSDGMKAKGLAMGIAFDRAAYRSFVEYEVAVIDAAIDRDGWGAWCDKGRNSTMYDWVLKRRQKRGADVPEPEEVDA